MCIISVVIGLYVTAGRGCRAANKLLIYIDTGRQNDGLTDGVMKRLQQHDDVQIAVNEFSLQRTSKYTCQMTWLEDPPPWLNPWLRPA